MTIIAVAKDKDGWAIGSDSQGTSGQLATFYGSKIIRRKNWACGYSWSYRVANMIEDSDALNFVIDNYTDARKWRDILRTELLEIGAKKEAVDSNSLPGAPVGLLLTNGKRAWSVNGDFSLLEIRGYDALGSGYEVAMGALFAFRGKSAIESVRMAIRAASLHVTTCGGKAHCVYMEKDGK